ncbi:MAG: tetratricopeptide repeat protein [Pseudomonadota bacterium]
MPNRLSLCAIAMFTMALPATGQAVIIGSGIAKDCFMQVQAQSSRFVEVDRLCTRALDLETMTRTNRAATYVNRGIIRMRAGNYDTALRDYERAINLEEGMGAAYLNRGAAFIHKGEYVSAMTALDRAIALETSDLPAAHYNRALAREQVGDVTGAYYDFKTASELMPEWPLPQQQLERFTVTGEPDA